jgi:hypothetical protein
MVLAVFFCCFGPIDGFLCSVCSLFFGLLFRFGAWFACRLRQKKSKLVKKSQKSSKKVQERKRMQYP